MPRFVLPSAVLLLLGTATLFAQTAAELRYAAVKDSAIRSLVARVQRREPFAKYKLAHDSALRDLTRRLRLIIGPFQAKQFSTSAHINTDDLFPDDADSGGLDALMYESADRTSSILVTTRSLLASWLDKTADEIPRNPITALGTPEFYTFAINTHSAVFKYASIPVRGASQLGVVTAMLVIRAQDTGPLTPDEVIVSVVRGSRVFIVAAPAAAKIDPPAACLAARDSIIALSAVQREAYIRAHITDSAALRRAINEDSADDIAYRGCYGERVPRDPAFQKIVAQVQAIVSELPPR
jgi:hypothetical protein